MPPSSPRITRSAAMVAGASLSATMLAAAEPGTRPQLGAWGVDLAGMDKSVKPGDDFYRFANGTWHARAEIPADKTDTGPAVSLMDFSFDRVKVLLEEAVADTSAPKGSDRRRLGDWYASILDEEKLVALGLTPLRPDLDRIQALDDRGPLADLLAANNGGLGAAPLGVGWEFDPKHVNQTLVEITTSGLSLPREVYLEAAYEPVRRQYREHIARALALAGLDDTPARAARALDLEIEIARFTWPKSERDPVKRFNPTAPGDLSKVAPGIDWARFLEQAGVGAPRTVDLKTPSSITGMAKLIAEGGLPAWRDYLTYHLLNNTKTYLPKPVRDEFFGFFGKVVGGQPEPEPRWKSAVWDIGWQAGSPLSDALGKAFIERYVTKDSRPQVQAIIQNLMTAFDARLAKLAWMTPETRKEAREKLAKVTIKVIYPDVWQTSEGLDVVRGDAMGNARRGSAFTRQRELSWLKTYPDKRIFFKPVFEVNAYANPAWNEVVFLAGIVRPPFFDPAADTAVNYGAMGAAIGHEVSHLFDDQGRKYDGDGLLRDWWTEADARQFVAATDKLAAQVGSYEPLPGKHVDGRLTLGESIGDLAGLVVAYDAYHLSLGGKEPPVIDGFTGDQRFFLGYAQAWRYKPRDAYLDKLLKIDVHPPSFIRPQTVRNVDAWYKAFDVKPGDKLYLPPAERVNPW